MAKKKPPASVSPPSIDGLEWASQTQLKTVPWLWPGCIPANTLTMIEGRKATGKSSVLAAIAAAVTGGPAIPSWTGPRNGHVLWCGSEESWEAVTAPRLKAAGAILSRVARLAGHVADGQRQRLLLPEHLAVLRDYLISGRIRLLILDPYISLISPAVDTRQEQAIRSVLEPLLDLAWETECTILLVRHVRKGRVGDAREAGLGGAGLTNVCRALLRLDEHPHLAGHSILSPVAVSAAGVVLAGQVFKLDYKRDGPPLQWIGATDLDAQTVSEGLGDAVERGETREAEQLLVELINSSWVRAGTIITEAQQAGISPRSLRRAKERLLVSCRRVSYGQEGYWEWGPPKSGWPESVRHLIRTGPSAHTQGGALPFDNAKKRAKSGKIRKGAKAPPACAPTQGALPDAGGKEVGHGA